MFDVNIKHYGYEDTAFSITMKKHKIKVEHINNTVIHLGLTDNKEYLNNIKTSLHNLLYLSRKEELNFKIIKYYNLTLVVVRLSQMHYQLAAHYLKVVVHLK